MIFNLKDVMFIIQIMPFLFLKFMPLLSLKFMPFLFIKFMPFFQAETEFYLFKTRGSLSTMKLSATPSFVTVRSRENASDVHIPHSRTVGGAAHDSDIYI